MNNHCCMVNLGLFLVTKLPDPPSYTRTKSTIFTNILTRQKSNRKTDIEQYKRSRFKCSQKIASLNVLMMLKVSMTVSHLCQNVENIKSVRSLKQASEGVNYWKGVTALSRKKKTVNKRKHT